MFISVVSEPRSQSNKCYIYTVDDYLLNNGTYTDNLVLVV